MNERLYQAIRAGSIENVKKILSTRSYLLNEVLDELDGAALAVASRYNQTEIVEYLLTQPNLNKDQGNHTRDTTALMWAAEAGNENVVQLLLNNPPLQINKQRKDLTTALHDACAENRAKVVQMLLTHPDIDVNIKDDQGRTPLHVTCIRGYLEIAELLLNHPKIDPTIRNNHGKTANELSANNFPLRKLIENCALKKKDSELSKSPKAMKAPVFISSDTRSRMLAACSTNKISNVQAIVSDYPGIVNEEISPAFGTPLSVSAAHGNAAIVTYLLSSPDIDVNKGDLLKNQMPLTWAVYHNKNEVVELLLKRPELEINKQSKIGCTVLHYACLSNNSQAIQYLLELREDININLKDNKGETALHKASYKGNLEIIQLFLKYQQDKIALTVTNNFGESAWDLSCNEEKCDKSKKLLIRQTIEEAIKLQKTMKHSESENNSMKYDEENSTSKNKGNSDQWEEGIYGSWNHAKIMIVGGGRAGKTSFVRSLTGQEFNEHLFSTIGINEFQCLFQQDIENGKRSIELPSSPAEKEGGAQNHDQNNNQITNFLEYSIAKENMEKSMKGVYQMFYQVDNNENNNNLENNFKDLSFSNHSHATNNTTTTTIPISEQVKLYVQDVNQEKIQLYQSMIVENVQKRSKLLKYFLTIYDYGGQHIFHLIHALFLSKNGIYFLVFNLNDLLSTNDEISKLQCLDEIRFWLNSIALHSSSSSSHAHKHDTNNMQMTESPNTTNNNSSNIASIYLIGTRGDMIQNPEEHEDISLLLTQHFQHHICWNSIITNPYGIGRKGNTNFCFYPINNLLGNQDPMIMQLIKSLDSTILQLPFMNQKLFKRNPNEMNTKIHHPNYERIPLISLKMMDILLNYKNNNLNNNNNNNNNNNSNSKKSFITWDEMEQLINFQLFNTNKSTSNKLTKKGNFTPSMQSYEFMLSFLHDNGLILWHNETNLRNIIILNPIEYFIVPLTIIICKHKSIDALEDPNDATRHFLSIHSQCAKRYTNDWMIMNKYGFLSYDLINDLLSEQCSTSLEKELLISLMIKYSFLLPLTDKRSFKDVSGFLVPSLLPDISEKLDYHSSTSSPQDSSDNLMLQFYFSFYLSQLYEDEMVFTTKKECKSLGFLPSGFFDRLLCRLITVCLEDNNSNNNDNNNSNKNNDTNNNANSPVHSNMISWDWKKYISRNSITLTFKQQPFSLLYDAIHNLLEVKVISTNPIPIYLMLSQQIQIICQECYQNLRFITLLHDYRDNHSHQKISNAASTTNPDKTTMKFINFHYLENCVLSNTSMSSMNTDVSNLKKEYNLWLYQYKQFFAISNYDIFISYRWVDHQDSKLVISLFEQFLFYNLNSTSSGSVSSSSSSYHHRDDEAASSSSSNNNNNSNYHPVSVFLDRKRLQDGENFKEEFSLALLSSRMIIPVITVEALTRFIYHNPETIDNLLLEWILALHLIKQKPTALNNSFPKLLPIVFGSFEYSTITQNIINLKGIESLHDIITYDYKNNNTKVTLNQRSIMKILSTNNIKPLKTIELAEKLLMKHRSENLLAEIKNMCINEIISSLLSYQSKLYIHSICPFPLPMKLNDLTNYFANYLVFILESTLSSANNNNTNINSKNGHVLLKEEDYYFYNIPLPPQSIQPSANANNNPDNANNPSPMTNSSHKSSKNETKLPESGNNILFEDELKAMGLNQRIISALIELNAETIDDVRYFYVDEDLLKQLKDKLIGLDFAKFKAAAKKFFTE